MPSHRRTARPTFLRANAGRRIASGTRKRGILGEHATRNLRIIFASQYQQNPISLERVNAIDAERERRFSDAYRSMDRLTLGRLWHNRITGTPEDEISDDL